MKILISSLLACSLLFAGTTSADPALVIGMAATFGGSPHHRDADQTTNRVNYDLALYAINERPEDSVHTQNTMLFSMERPTTKLVIYANEKEEGRTGEKVAKTAGIVVVGYLVLAAIGVKLIAEGLDDKD